MLVLAPVQWVLWCARLGLCSPSSPGSSQGGTSVSLQGLGMGQKDSLHLQPLGNGFVPPVKFSVSGSVAAEGTGHSPDGSAAGRDQLEARTWRSQ